MKRLTGTFGPKSSAKSGHNPGQSGQSASGKDSKVLKRTENDLFLHFPSIERRALHEVFLAMNCDADAAIDVVGSSIKKTDLPIQMTTNPHFTVACTSIKYPADMGISVTDLPIAAKISTADNSEYRNTDQRECGESSNLYVPCLQRNLVSYPNYSCNDINETIFKMITESCASSKSCFPLLDLHGLHCDEAIEFLRNFLQQVRERGLKGIDVITGRGAHSKGSLAKVKPAVLSHLNNEHCRYDFLNEGYIRVYLR